MKRKELTLSEAYDVVERLANVLEDFLNKENETTEKIDEARHHRFIEHAINIVGSEYTIVLKQNEEK